MTASTSREEARALAGNLASLWTGGRETLDAIAGAVGDVASSPWAALAHLTDDELERVLEVSETGIGLHAAFTALTRYLAAETWFDRAIGKDSRLETLRDGPVAYFCMEFGLAGWLPIYSGGLGILAGDALKEASDMGLPLVGVGLFYRHGYFTQRIDDTGYQQEAYPPIDPSNLPLEAAVDDNGAELRVDVPVGEKTIYARIWKLKVGRVPLYLLDTDVQENTSQSDREIVRNLYGGDEDTRIKQELVLGIGGRRALRALGIEPSMYSMNEGHAGFLGLEILADIQRNSDSQMTLSRTRSRIVYTNHTVVAAGNDVFDREQIRRYLGPYAEQHGIGIDRLLSLGAASLDQRFSMPLLAFRLSGKANAVSRIHADVIPRQWPGHEVEAVTNGVHAPTWLGPCIRALLDMYVPDWHEDEPHWQGIRAIPDALLISARDEQRRLLVDLVNQLQPTQKLDPMALTVVWARRFAEYKRAWLIGSDLERLSRLLTNPDRPVQIIIAGKSHPRDEGGKRMMQELLRHLRGNPCVAERVVFVEDYTERVARYLVSGADVWLNTPRKPLEASGTSGMKSSDNGGIQLTVMDGWAAEVDWRGIGWGVEGRDDQFDAQQLYGFLEDGVIPTFYRRRETPPQAENAPQDAHGIATNWASMMKSTMILTLSRFSTRRMMRDYVNKLYLPLLEEQAELSPV